MVLGVDPGPISGVIWAKRPRHPPVVLTRDEVRAILAELDGTPRLVAGLLYGSGLRLLEGLRLRVHNLAFVRNEILVRDGKGQKDRVTMLPAAVRHSLLAHLDEVREIHRRDLQAGSGRVYLPDALDRKYPEADRAWGWQYVFPSRTLSRDPRSDVVRRHHLDESTIQRPVKEAVRRAG